MDPNTIPPQQPQQPTPPQPVAYDAEGRPLYHHPPIAPPAVNTIPPQQLQQTQSYGAGQSPQVQQQAPIGVPVSHVTTRPEQYEGHNFDPQLRSQYANEPSVVHASRPLEPVVEPMSDALRQKHEDSMKRYPFLNLSEGEFVMLQIKRHPIGLLLPVGLTMLILIALASLMILYPDIQAESVSLPGPGVVSGLLLATMLLVGAGGFVLIWVYLQNQFFLTNESVIQEIQHGLFSRHEQTVSLGSIEDASFKRYGILQSILDYGTMRLSTEGEETTYRFAYVENPKKQVAIVNNAVEAFKNGRPVGADFLEDEN